jgi:uncharacterized membrane protein YdjX (TVP38/TMEM64 family)
LSYGKYSAFAFILLYGLKPIVFIIPASLLSIIAGSIFGPFKSLLLSLIGCFLSGTLAFYMSRFLGKSFVNKLLKGKALNLNSSIEKHGFKIMLAMRLSFIFPYDALSFAAGLSEMKYYDFILGTMIGIVPEILTYSFMGNNIKNPLSIKFIAPIIVILLIAVTSHYFYNTYKKDE